MIHSMKRSLIEVPLTNITVSKANMRAFYDSEALDALNGSMARIGQIYPVLLKRLPQEDHFELLVGSRRLKAAWRAKMKTIMAHVLDDISLPEMVILSLTENLHREDLTPFEEAKALLELSTNHGMSPKEIAKQIHKPVPWVTGRLKILSVPQTVQELLAQNRVTINHVGIIGSLKKPKDQIRYAKIVAKQALSEEDLITLIREEAAKKGVTPPVRTERLASNDLFTPMRTALKVKRFLKFLNDKVRLQLALEGEEVVELRKALRRVRNVIKTLLARSKARN